MTLALSIRQPWCFAILHGGKDIENRNWPTKVRGRILIHASKKHDGGDSAADIFDLMSETGFSDAKIDRLVKAHPLEFGGIVGEVEIVDCVARHESKWFFGPFGFVLRNAKPLPFRPFKGRLGFFNVEE